MSEEVKTLASEAIKELKMHVESTIHMIGDSVTSDVAVDRARELVLLQEALEICVQHDENERTLIERRRRHEEAKAKKPVPQEYFSDDHLTEEDKAVGADGK